MAEIVNAKGLRYTITLYDDEVNIKENAKLIDKAGNVLKKINFLKKDKDVLLNRTFKLSEIKNAFYTNPTQDTSVMKLELSDSIVKEFEMTPTDTKNSNALKTQVKQIVDYIQEKK